MIVTVCIQSHKVNVSDVCHQIALFAVHSTWLRCISMCICVTVLEFVHVQICIMYGKLCECWYVQYMCVNVHVVSYTLLFVHNN